MEQAELKLSPKRLKHFFVHCSLSAKKLSEKQKLRSEFSGRLQKLKDMSLKTGPARGKSPNVMSEIEKLEERIADLINIHAREKVERDALMRKLDESIKAVQPRQDVKPFRDFERISSRLAENVNKLSKVGEAEKRLEKEFKEEKGELENLEKHLNSLEKRYNELKKSRKNKKDLERIRLMIEKHKKTISSMKQKK